MAVIPTVKPVSAPSKRLAASITADSTSFQMSDILGWDGTDLVQADFGEVAYGAFRDANGTVLELFSFDPTTIGSTSITFVKRGLDFTGDRTTEVSANKLEWVKGTTIVEIGSDFPMLFQYLIDYIDNIALQSAPDASTTTKGVSKMSVAPASASNPIAVGDNDPRVPTQSENDAMAGTSGTPSSSNKFQTAEGASDGSTDQSQTTQNSSSVVGEADATGKRNLLAQSFTAGTTQLRGVALNKQADSGSFVGTVKIAIQADSAGSPSGSDLVSKTITNTLWLAYSTGEFLAFFTSEITLTKGSTYWIVVTPSTSDNTNHPNLGLNTAGGYSSGSVKYKNTTDGWVAVSTVDLYFKTFSGYVGKDIKGDSNGLSPHTARKLLTKIGTLTFTSAANQTVTHSLGKVPALIRGWSGGGSSSAGGSSMGVYDVAAGTYSGFVNWYRNGTSGSEVVYTDKLCIPNQGSAAASSNNVTIVAIDENIIIFTISAVVGGNQAMAYEIIA